MVGCSQYHLLRRITSIAPAPTHSLTVAKSLTTPFPNMLGKRSFLMVLGILATIGKGDEIGAVQSPLDDLLPILWEKIGQDKHFATT